MIRIESGILSSKTYPYPVEEWWLVFTETEERYWWNRLLRKGFRHVYAMRQQFGVWVRVNFRVPCLDVEILDIPVYTPVHLAVEPGAKVVRVLAYRNQDRVRWPWVAGPVTCVETTKALLGVRRFFLWTPYQLYRYVRCGVIVDGRQQQEAKEVRSREGA